MCRSSLQLPIRRTSHFFFSEDDYDVFGLAKRITSTVSGKLCFTSIIEGTCICIYYHIRHCSKNAYFSCRTIQENSEIFYQAKQVRTERHVTDITRGLDITIMACTQL